MSFRRIGAHQEDCQVMALVAVIAVALLAFMISHLYALDHRH